MGTRYRLGTWLWIAAAVLSLSGLVYAQAPKGKARPPAKPAKVQPKVAPADGESKVPSKQPPAVEIQIVDPQVQAILDMKPSTPSEMVRAGRLLADFQRADLAKGLFRKVLDSKPGPKELAALVDEFGSPAFMEMSTRPDLAPEGTELAGAVLQAKNQQVQEPQRIAALIGELQAPSAEQRMRAQVGLQEAGEAAIRPLVEVLADPQRAAQHAAVRTALAQLGPDAVAPLVSVLEAQDPKLAAQAALALAETGITELSVYLLAPFAKKEGDAGVRAAAQTALVRLVGRTPTPQQAARLLAERARRYVDRLQPLPADATGRVTVWTWDGAAKQPVAKALLPEDAGRWHAARFAREAYSVMPEDRDLVVLYLTTMLEQAAYESGLDKPMPPDKPLPLEKGTPTGKAAEFTVEVLEQVLAFSMERGQVGAAAATARLLGQRADAERLLSRSAQPCPLVRAMRHGNPHVRLAAVEAIVRMQPSGAFAGASYVVETLSFLAASRGSRRALVACPGTEESQRMSALLTAMGFEVSQAATGRDLIRLALQSPDYELALVDAGVDHPTVDFLVQQLRRDGRTALVPVGIFARDDQIDRARHVAAGDARVRAFFRPRDTETAQQQVQRVLALSGREAVSTAQRRDHAAKALQWLFELTDNRSQRFHDFQRAEGAVLAALQVPELSGRAAAVLANLGTAESQQALVELAGRATAPLAARTAALGGFRRATEQYGILLTTDQIRLQYERYNQSGTLDEATRKVLGLILDCIEAPTQAARSLRQGVNQPGSTAASLMR